MQDIPVEAFVRFKPNPPDLRDTRMAVISVSISSITSSVVLLLERKDWTDAVLASNVIDPVNSTYLTPSFLRVYPNSSSTKLLGRDFEFDIPAKILQLDFWSASPS